MSFPFNVRAYGVLVIDGAVLLSAEKYRGVDMVKLPGGGLEFGEGLRDCLVREFREETGLDIRVGEHLYTTDFFQISAFDASHQLISVYYRVFPIRRSDFLKEIQSLEENKHFFWKSLSALQADDFTFPVDRVVYPILKEIR